MHFGYLASEASVSGRYFPIFSGITWKMELNALIRVTHSMNKVFCNYTTQEEHDLKGSCYPGKKGWTCSITRLNASFSALAGLANWANREK